MSEARKIASVLLSTLAKELNRDTKNKLTFERWNATIATATLISGVVTAIVIYKQTENLDRSEDTLRVCEAYVTNAVVNDAQDKYRNLNREQKASGEFGPAEMLISKFPDKTVRDDLQFNGTKWLNFLDTIAIGVKAGVYDRKYIKDCLGHVFSDTIPLELKAKGNGDAIFPWADFPNTAYLACEWKDLTYPRDGDNSTDAQKNENERVRNEIDTVCREVTDAQSSEPE